MAPVFRRPLKILHLAPANWTGTLDLLVAEHRKRGHIADFVTLTRSPEGFDDGLSLDLWPGRKSKPGVFFRNLIMRNSTPGGKRRELPGNPPLRELTPLHALFLRLQDFVYGPRIRAAIQKHGLMDYDIYHLESGVDFFKDYRTLPLLKDKGVILIGSWHGNDFRNLGVPPQVHRLADAHVSSEWDVVLRYPGCRYSFLPLRPLTVKPNRGTGRVVVAHLVRNRAHYYYKGTDDIIRVAEDAVRGRDAEFRLISGRSHDEALAELAKAHILVDQINGKAGFGYGMSAVEALSLGAVVCVEMQKEIEPFLPGHPFVAVKRDTLKDALIELIENKSELELRGRQGLDWVKANHSVEAAVDRFHELYAELLESRPGRA